MLSQQQQSNTLVDNTTSTRGRQTDRQAQRQRSETRQVRRHRQTDSQPARRTQGDQRPDASFSLFRRLDIRLKVGNLRLSDKESDCRNYLQFTNCINTFNTKTSIQHHFPPQASPEKKNGNAQNKLPAGGWLYVLGVRSIFYPVHIICCDIIYCTCTKYVVVYLITFTRVHIIRYLQQCCSIPWYTTRPNKLPGTRYIRNMDSYSTDQHKNTWKKMKKRSK